MRGKGSGSSSGAGAAARLASAASLPLTSSFCCAAGMEHISSSRALTARTVSSPSTLSWCFAAPCATVICIVGVGSPAWRKARRWVAQPALQGKNTAPAARKRERVCARNGAHSRTRRGATQPRRRLSSKEILLVGLPSPCPASRQSPGSWRYCRAPGDARSEAAGRGAGGRAKGEARHCGAEMRGVPERTPLKLGLQKRLRAYNCILCVW